MRLRLKGVRAAHARGKHADANRTRALPDSAGGSGALLPAGPLHTQNADITVPGACR